MERVTVTFQNYNGESCELRMMVDQNGDSTIKTDIGQVSKQFQGIHIGLMMLLLKGLGE